MRTSLPAVLLLSFVNYCQPQRDFIDLRVQITKMLLFIIIITYYLLFHLKIGDSRPMTRPCRNDACLPECVSDVVAVFA